MKKNLTFFVLGCIVALAITATGSVFAENTNATIDAIFGQVKLFVNGKPVEKETLLYDGRTYLPLRDTADALGKEVAWDEKVSSAYIDNAGTYRQYLIDGIEPPASKSTPKPSPKPTAKPTPKPSSSPTPEPAPSPTPRAYSYYKENKDIIDFGEMFGIALADKYYDKYTTIWQDEVKQHTYSYFVKDLPEGWYKEYMTALESIGFKYDNDFENNYEINYEIYRKQGKYFPSFNDEYKGVFKKGDTRVRISESKGDPAKVEIKIEPNEDK